MKEEGRLLKEEISDMSMGFLINAANRTYSAFLFVETKKLGITWHQLQFLIGLSRIDGITQEELANDFYMNESTIARALRKLEESGMVQREIDENNRRRKIITITEKGRTTVTEFRKIDETWEEKFKSLSLEEKDQLKSLLRTMVTESMTLMSEFRK